MEATRWDISPILRGFSEVSGSAKRYGRVEVDSPGRVGERAEQVGGVREVQARLAHAEQDSVAIGTARVSPYGTAAEAGAGGGVKTTALGLHPPYSVGRLGCFHEILEADQKAPKKQRHTAKRIFERVKRRLTLARPRFGKLASNERWPCS